MSSVTKVALIFAGILLACLVAAAIVIGVTFGREGGVKNVADFIGSEEFQIDESETFDLDGISAMSVECTSGNVEFVASDEMKATLSGTVITNKDITDFLSVQKQGDTLNIVVDKDSLWPDVRIKMALTIYIPADSMIDLKVDSTSGNFNVAGMSFGDMEIKKSSGNAKFENVTASTLVYNSISGNIDIVDSQIGSMEVLSTSGDIDIENASGAIFVRSTSGNTNIVGADGALDIGGTSGDITVELASADIGPVSLERTSGNIKIYMSADTAFDFEGKTTSGNITSDIPISVTGELGESFSGDNVRGSANGGGPLIKAQVTSGNIRIIEK